MGPPPLRFCEVESSRPRIGVEERVMSLNRAMGRAWATVCNVRGVQLYPDDEEVATPALGPPCQS